MAGKRGRSGPPGNANALQHGYYALKDKLQAGKGLDKRTAIARAIRARGLEFNIALGGDPSPQLTLLITDTVITEMYESSLDRYLMGLKSLVRKGRPHPVLAERTRLAAHIRENLKALGLKRVPPPRPSLAEMLVEEEEEQGEEQAGNRETDPAECPTEEDQQNGSGDGDTPGELRREQ